MGDFLLEIRKPRQFHHQLSDRESCSTEVALLSSASDVSQPASRKQQLVRMLKVISVIAVFLLGASVLASSLGAPNHAIEERNDGAVAKQKCLELNKTSRGTDHVLQGTRAKLDEFPYMAALGVPEGGNITFKCGASLISKEYLLTAAHCFKEKTLTMARFGVVNLFNPIPADPPVDIEIKQVIYHGDNQNHDIALVQLNRSIREDENFIHPICLYTESEDPNPKLNLTIAGWGRNDPNSDENGVLLRGPVNVWSEEDCSDAVEKMKEESKRQAKRIMNKLCASKLYTNGSTEVDTCKGDSGGPLELEQDDRRYLVGITSTGEHCGSTGKPGYYIRVSRYIDWIEKQVWPETKPGNPDVQ